MISTEQLDNTWLQLHCLFKLLWLLIHCVKLVVLVALVRVSPKKYKEPHTKKRKEQKETGNEKNRKRKERGGNRPKRPVIQYRRRKTKNEVR